MVEPPIGFFGQTSFTIKATDGWTDDPSDLPLMFFFGYYVQEPESGEQREEMLQMTSEDNSVVADLLPQGKAFVFSNSTWDVMTRRSLQVKQLFDVTV